MPGRSACPYGAAVSCTCPPAHVFGSAPYAPWVRFGVRPQPVCRIFRQCLRAAAGSAAGTVQRLPSAGCSLRLCGQGIRRRSPGSAIPALPGRSRRAAVTQPHRCPSAPGRSCMVQCAHRLRDSACWPDRLSIGMVAGAATYVLRSAAPALEEQGSDVGSLPGTMLYGIGQQLCQRLPHLGLQVLQ